MNEPYVFHQDYGWFHVFTWADNGEPVTLLMSNEWIEKEKDDEPPMTTSAYCDKCEYNCPTKEAAGKCPFRPMTTGEEV